MLEEGQAGIQIAGRNLNNLRYADDTTHMAESADKPLQSCPTLRGPIGPPSLGFSRQEHWSGL